MSSLNFYLLLPYLFLINAAIALLWCGLYCRNRIISILPTSLLAIYSVFVLLLCSLLIMNTPFEYSILSSYVILQSYSKLYLFIILLTSILVLLLIAYHENRFSLKNVSIELYFLRFVIIISLVFLSIANDLILIFFFLETYSLSSYVLVAQRGKNSVFSSEAGVKYFVLGTLFSLFFAYGVSFIYSATGTTNISLIVALSDGFLLPGKELSTAFVFVLIGLLFKLAAAPFHFWAPDVYEAAPTSAMFFLSVVPKATLMLLLINLYNCYTSVNLDSLVYFAGVLSILVGSLAGIYQKRIKRLLTYSSISNTGFILASLLGLTFNSAVFLTFFLVIYLLTSIGLFTIVYSLRKLPTKTTVKNINNLTNIFFIHRSLAIALAILLFSSAGLPPFIGFLSKFVVLFSLSSVDYSSFLLWALLAAPLSVFYYIRILKVMSFKKQNYFIFLTPLSFFSATTVSCIVVSLVITLLCSNFILTFLALFF